jgi:hypothetical protein
MEGLEREAETLPDLDGEQGERISSPFGPHSVRKDTMWEARLVLSTLEPAGPWAARLRSAIRQGNRYVVDAILAAVYAERGPVARHASAPPPAVPSSRPIAKCTVLPPSPARRAAG